MIEKKNERELCNECKQAMLLQIGNKMKERKRDVGLIVLYIFNTAAFTFFIIMGLGKLIFNILVLAWCIYVLHRECSFCNQKENIVIEED